MKKHKQPASNNLAYKNGIWDYGQSHSHAADILTVPISNVQEDYKKEDETAKELPKNSPKKQYKKIITRTKRIVRKCHTVSCNRITKELRGIRKDLKIIIDLEKTKINMDRHIYITLNSSDIKLTEPAVSETVEVPFQESNQDLDTDMKSEETITVAKNLDNSS